MAIWRFWSGFTPIEAKGHLDVVRFLQDNRRHECPNSSDTMRMVARHGHLKTLQWLYTNRSGGCVVLALQEAAKLGHLNVVKWLCEVAHEQRRGESCFRGVAGIARRFRRLEVGAKG